MGILGLTGEMMTKRTRRNHTPIFKAKVSMTALKGDRTLAELAQAFDVHANQITQWRTERWRERQVCLMAARMAPMRLLLTSRRCMPRLVNWR